LKLFWQLVVAQHPIKGPMASSYHSLTAELDIHPRSPNGKLQSVFVDSV
jgi:hypothetical protein